MRGIFHHHVDGETKTKDDVAAAGAAGASTTTTTSTSCVSILHASLSIATLANWEDEDDDEDSLSIAAANYSIGIGSSSNPMPMTTTTVSVVDDTTPLEHSRRVAIASSHGFHYDEKLGVASILESLSLHEVQSLSDPQMPLRHYRAEKGNVLEAIRKLKSTLQWREEFGVENIKRCFDTQSPSSDTSTLQQLQSSSLSQQQPLANIIAHENATGKIYARGYDKQGRAILYLTPGKENSNNEIDNMRHLVYHLERAIACTQRKSGRSKVCIVIGYQGFSLRNAPPLSTTRHTLTILQNHYPERLHRVYICDPPLVFRTFWSIIHHFIDPTTLEKIAFCAAGGSNKEGGGGGGGTKFFERDFDTMTTEKQAGGRACLREFDSKEYLLDTPFDYTFDEKR
jgi:hypothetical protein